jgi:hypothetical protein
MTVLKSFCFEAGLLGLARSVVCSIGMPEAQPSVKGIGRDMDA